MNQMFRSLKKEERKTILLLCDDIRLHSGIATMAKEIVIGTAHHFNWVNLGAALQHPDHGKTIDLSEDTAKESGVEDASVILHPSTGYGDAATVRSLLQKYKPDAILIFTDPRYWIWLFEMEREIRSQIPIFYLNIWDDYPAPMYNRAYYESCDLLMGISKQTVNVNRLTLGEKAEGKLLKYVPHGINEKHFFPIGLEDKEDLAKFEAFKQNLFSGDSPEFVVFWNSRNIHRKHPSDVILSYRIFCDMIGEENAKKCALVMHTAPVDQNGTDLFKVREALCDPDYVKVYFSSNKLETAQMNLLYNVADVTMLISSNEGWGLSLTESMMAGTPIIANVTGGMQDQMRFVNYRKQWIDFDADFPSNHRGTYKECGEWAYPVFPSSINVAGSIPTPYIFDDRCEPTTVAEQLVNVFNTPKEERKRRGLKGREWVTSEESGMSAANMCKNVIEACDEALEKFQPRSSYDLIKIEELPKKYVSHKLHSY